MLGELLPQGGGDSIPLRKSKLLIGRRDSCDISLRFPNVSSHHCEIELLNGYWRVRDLGSSNGTKVNGVRVDTKWLMPGDELSVAKHRYTVSYTPQTEGPPPQEETEDLQLSLMEKAGLVKRKDISPPAAPAGQPAKSRAAAPKTDEDRALEWLDIEGDDDDDSVEI